MDVEAFVSRERGEIRPTINRSLAFHPAPLPREIALPPETVALLSSATGALYNLGGTGRLLPNPDLLIIPYIRAEAVLSSKIEGTESTISDILKVQVQDESSVPRGDVREVLNYVRAMDHGLARLREGMPLCLRLVKEMQEILLAGVRGQKRRGEFRDEQNWIGPPECRLEDATYVPPPVDYMHEALADWEKFLHLDAARMPILVKVALAHYQFEAIHPFFDGNGRIGRLMIPLTLVAEGALSAPLLYLSVYFERRRTTYYRHLLETSQSGELLPWVEFFLEGVRSQAVDAQARTVRLVEEQRSLRQRLMDSNAPTSVLALAESLLVNPYVTSTQAMRIVSGTRPTAQKAIDTLAGMGVLVEMTGQRRNRLYFAPSIYEAIYGDFEARDNSREEGPREATQAAD
ncbi:MAG TPA: Fic family protein [Egibacteraceae bacterium]|nr:Fic family protein [Egibacteraceae bacterium]